MTKIRTSLLALAAMSLSACSQGSLIKSQLIGAGDNDGAYYALPRGLVAMVIKREECKFDVEPGTVEIMPDPAARFRLQIDHDEFSEDTLDVVTDPKGLLTSVTGTSKDQTTQALTQIVKLIGMAEGIPPASAEQSEGGTPCDKVPKEKTNFKYAALFDPAAPPDSPVGVDAANTFLLPLGVQIEAKPTAGTPSPGVTDDEMRKQLAKTCANAVCFRPAVPYLITVTQRSNPATQVEYQTHRREFLALTPDPDPAATMALKLTRQLFAESKHTLTFSNGMLTKYDTTKHSEVVSALQLPLDVGSAILALPSQLLTVNVKRTKEETELIGEQIKLLQAQTNLSNELAKRSATAPPPQTPPAN